MSRLPKISGLRLLRLVPKLLRKPLPALQSVVEKHGRLIEFNGGKYQQLFFVSDPEAVKYILKTNKDNFKRSPVIKALQPLLGNGIFISEDETWKSQRLALKPAFHEQVILDFEKVILQETHETIQQWRELTYSKNIESDVSLLMLRILARTQFCQNIDLDFKEIQRAHVDVLKQTSIRNQKVDFYHNKLRKRFGFQPKSNKPTKALEYLHTVATYIISYGRTHVNECSYWLNDMIVRHEPESAIKDQILNFIFAGYDTTASALSWTLYCLATETEGQTACRQEASKTPIEFSHIGKLSYIKNCIQESMRLYPPVWSIHRQSVEADIVSGQAFDAGSYFMICSYTLHRDPDLWESPNSFDPLRFESEKMRGKAFQYIPFGQGERVCIGQSLAIMEMQLILGVMLQQFEFSYSRRDAPDIIPGIIMKSKGGIWLDVKATS